MKKLRWLRILGAILVAAGLVGLGVGLLASSAMVVAIGVRGVSRLLTASYIVLGVGGAAVVGGTVPAVIGAVRQQNDDRLLQSRREQDKRNLSEYAKDSLNPEKTRMRLEQLRRNNPNLSGLVDLCMEQMDRIDTYQARQRTLLDANEAIYLEDTIEVLDESERRMCRNFRNIINCCILVEDSRGSAGELDSAIINSALADNEEELKSVSTLLQYSVAYINNYNRNGVSDRRELDAWLKVMKTSIGSGQSSKLNA